MNITAIDKLPSPHRKGIRTQISDRFWARHQTTFTGGDRRSLSWEVMDKIMFSLGVDNYYPVQHNRSLLTRQTETHMHIARWLSSMPWFHRNSQDLIS